MNLSKPTFAAKTEEEEREDTVAGPACQEAKKIPTLFHLGPILSSLFDFRQRGKKENKRPFFRLAPFLSLLQIWGKGGREIPKISNLTDDETRKAPVFLYLKDVTGLAAAAPL